MSAVDRCCNIWIAKIEELQAILAGLPPGKERQTVEAALEYLREAVEKTLRDRELS